jgi:hypothetical protein
MGQAREHVVAKVRELVVGVVHPPIVQVDRLDEELRPTLK